MTNNRFEITVSGERLRSFLTLRLKEYDRHLELSHKVLSLGLSEEADELVELKRQVERGIDRVDLNTISSYQPLVEQYGSNRVIRSGSRRSDQIAENIALIQYGKSQIQWLAESINPDAAYTLGGPDLYTLGFTAGMGQSIRAVVDPLI